MVNVCLITEQIKTQDKLVTCIAKIHKCIKKTIKVCDVLAIFIYCKCGVCERRVLSDKDKQLLTCDVKMALCFQVRAKEKSIHDPINISVNVRHGMKRYF